MQLLLASDIQSVVDLAGVSKSYSWTLPSLIWSVVCWFSLYLNPVDPQWWVLLCLPYNLMWLEVKVFFNAFADSERFSSTSTDLSSNGTVADNPMVIGFRKHARNGVNDLTSYLIFLESSKKQMPFWTSALNVHFVNTASLAKKRPRTFRIFNVG